MREGHFRELGPVCPACRRAGRGDRPLAVSLAEREAPGRLVDGVLRCPDAACRQEYPVVGGLPVLVPGVRAFLRDTSLYLLLRDDLEPGVLSLLAEATGPGSALESLLQQMSTYGADHWGDLDAAAPEAGGAGAARRCLARGLGFLPGPPPDGPVLDAGCAAGRTTFDLGAAFGRTTLGIDVNPMLAGIARRVLEQGVVRYPLRRVGLAYQGRTHAWTPPGAGRVDVWLCDLAQLPFRDGTFALAAALNVLDCLPDPAAGAAELVRVLRPGGAGVVSCPFDWSGAVTPPENWLGGRDGRDPGADDQHGQLEALLAAQAGPGRRVRLLGGDPLFSWRVRLHARASIEYATSVISFLSEGPA